MSMLSDMDPMSPYALNPVDPTELRELMIDVDNIVESGVNPRTAKGEKSAWLKYYVPYCQKMRTAVWRGCAALTHPFHEAAFISGFLMSAWRLMKPRSNKDTAPRVDSLRNVLGHIRRRHDRRGQMCAPSRMISHVLRGIARTRLRDHGVALPQRVEPFTVEENVLLKGVPITTKVAGSLRNETFWDGWRLVDTYGDQAGPRKSEVVGFEDIYFTRFDAQFEVQGVLHSDPDEATLRAMVPMRDKVIVRVNVSKADFDGTKFGPNLVSLLYNPNNPMSFAAALVDYELKHPLRGLDARQLAPLFTYDGKNRWTGNLIDATLDASMKATLTPSQRKSKTFHSKRVWVATGLTALHSSEGEVQAFVRWSSAESLRIYARMDLNYQAQRRDALVGADVRALNATQWPDIGDATAQSGADECNELADAIELE
jgi:hypothetical protein